MEMGSHGDSNEFSCSFPLCHNPKLPLREKSRGAIAGYHLKRCRVTLPSALSSDSGELAKGLGKINLSS